MDSPAPPMEATAFSSESLRSIELFAAGKQPILQSISVRLYFFCHLTDLWWDLLRSMNVKNSATFVAVSLFFLRGELSAQPTNPTPVSPETPAKDLRLTMPGSPLGIAWVFFYGYLGVKPEPYMPQVRDLGAGFTKVYLFWNQVEPQKGRYDWTAVDAFVGPVESARRRVDRAVLEFAVGCEASGSHAAALAGEENVCSGQAVDFPF